MTHNYPWACAVPTDIRNKENQHFEFIVNFHVTTPFSGYRCNCGRTGEFGQWQLVNLCKYGQEMGFHLVVVRDRKNESPWLLRHVIKTIIVMLQRVPLHTKGAL
jgi:hypothetical protein